MNSEPEVEKNGTPAHQQQLGLASSTCTRITDWANTPLESLPGPYISSMCWQISNNLLADLLGVISSDIRKQNLFVLSIKASLTLPNSSLDYLTLSLAHHKHEEHHDNQHRRTTITARFHMVSPVVDGGITFTSTLSFVQALLINATRFDRMLGRF